MRTVEELTEMISRIPDRDLGIELKRYLKQSSRVEEIQCLVSEFLEFYVKRSLPTKQ